MSATRIQAPLSDRALLQVWRGFTDAQIELAIATDPPFCTEKGKTYAIRATRERVLALRRAERATKAGVRA